MTIFVFAAWLFVPLGKLKRCPDEGVELRSPLQKAAATQARTKAKSKGPAGKAPRPLHRQTKSPRRSAAYIGRFNGGCGRAVDLGWAAMLPRSLPAGAGIYDPLRDSLIPRDKPAQVVYQQRVLAKGVRGEKAGSLRSG